MPFNVGSALRHAVDAAGEFFPCFPRTTPREVQPPIELERRDSGRSVPLPRQPLDATEENMRRMRLQQTHKGELKLQQLKFTDPSSSGHPERERERLLEDTPLKANQLRRRLHPLPAEQPTGKRQFVVSQSHDVKGVGFNDRGRPAATTGTSKPNVLCVTDGMGPCIAVALGAEKIAEDGTRLPGAKARVLHVQPMVTGLPQTLKERVEGYRNEGLTVRAALHGGWESIQSMAKDVRSALTKLDVPLEFDESCEKRNRLNTPLGAVVQDDHTVRFVTDLRYRP